jgi:hypothetical protein
MSSECHGCFKPKNATNEVGRPSGTNDARYLLLICVNLCNLWISLIRGFCVLCVFCGSAAPAGVLWWQHIKVAGG